jgi:hypothetical protein
MLAWLLARTISPRPLTPLVHGVGEVLPALLEQVRAEAMALSAAGDGDGR